MCSYFLHNICEKLVETQGGTISHSPKCDDWVSPNISIIFLVCFLENLFFQYNEIISTSKLPFPKPLVIKITKFLAYFSLDYENCPFTKFNW